MLEIDPGFTQARQIELRSPPREVVESHHLPVGVQRCQADRQRGADEACATGDQDATRRLAYGGGGCGASHQIEFELSCLRPTEPLEGMGILWSPAAARGSCFGEARSSLDWLFGCVWSPVWPIIGGPGRWR